MPPLKFLLILALLCVATPHATAAQGPPLPPDKTGLLYLSGFDTNQIGEYLPDGTLLRTISHPDMLSPRGVNVDDYGNLVVVCQDSDRILILDLEGNLLGAVTHPALTTGTGIARSPQGDWYVGNFFPGKVLIFDADWHYQSTLTETGMSGVNCVSFDFDGGFAVSSATSRKMFLFDDQNQLLNSVTHSSLSSPMSIAMDSVGNHFVSNGGSDVVTQFDSSWNYVRVFGTGVLDAPQGIAIDESDILTVTNYNGGEVHRYDNQGNFLGTFPATNLTTPRNLTWQTSKTLLAREGGVAASTGRPQRVLTANGSSGDAHGRLQIGANDALTVELITSTSGPTPAPFVLYAWLGEAGSTSVTEIPQISGLLCGPFPPGAGLGYTLVNSIGLTGTLGQGIFPAVVAPGTALTLPTGLGSMGVFTLQAILQDDGAATAPTMPWSTTNALVIEFL